MSESHMNLALRQTVAAGAAASTDIPIAGITTRDVLKSVIELQHDPNGGGAGVSSFDVVDRTSVASITSDGNIQLTVVTTGNNLLVTYLAASELGGDLNRD